MTCVVIEPASSGVELVRAALELGHPVAVLTGSHGEAQAIEACRNAGARILAAQTNDRDAVRAAVARIPDAAAVMPGIEYAVETTAYVARERGLPGIGLDTAKRFRDKLEMRRALAVAGIPVPRFADLDDAPEAIAAVGFPAVVKPVDACGSLGVRRVDNAAALARIARSNTRKTIIDLGRAVGQRWMTESYIAGTEYSLEGIVTRQGPRVVAVTRKLLGLEPYFVEIGHLVEADLAPHERDALVYHVQTAVAALGLELGVFHAEARLSPDGPRIIEIAARLGGDRIPGLVTYATGVSLARLAVRSYLEGPIDAACIVRTSARVAGVRFFTNRRPRDFRDRIKHVVCVAENHAQLQARLAEAVPC
jgi:biotin carboxylase